MEATTKNPEFLRPVLRFALAEYSFFGGVLTASLGIGFIYGCYAKRNKTNEEFIMGNRNMSILPVTLSLICSFVSAVTLLGNPVEIYLYGVQHSLAAFGIFIMTLFLLFIYVPVYFRLQLTSAYEYFEWRFSRRVRLVTSCFAIVHLIIYMPTTAYGPSLALDQVAGLDTMISTSVIFVVCIIYSAMGGLKAVLWTDALQAFVMLASLIAVIATGMHEVGGFAILWEKAKITHRTNFFNFDTDPRTRYTVWTSGVASIFVYLTLFAATQAQIQRYNSVPTLDKARRTVIFNMFGLITVIILCGWIGLILYAYYFECDPIKAGIVKSTDQLLPLFAIEVLKKFPGIPGLLVAGLTCGTLSSISSALNSLAAVITVDFIKLKNPSVSEERLAYHAKISSVVTGVIAMILVYVVAEINKSVPVQPFSVLINGLLLGPILGAFTSGMFFPFVEEYGIFAGFLCSILLSGFLGVGGIFAGRAKLLPDQRLTLSTDGCALASPSSIFLSQSSAISYIKQGDWKALSANDPIHIKLWSSSHYWIPIIAVSSTIFVSLVVSGVVLGIKKQNEKRKVNQSLMSTPVLNLWRWIFGQKFIDEWIDSESPPFSGNPNLKIRQTAKPAVNSGNDQISPLSVII